MARPVKISDEAILDGAIDLFWRHGADRVSIRDLERSLEVRAPSIYRRFDSKDELLARCLDRYVDQQIGGRVGYFFADTSDPLEGLRSFFTFLLRPHPGEETLRGCLLTTTASRSESSTENTRHAINRGFEAIETALLLQVQACIDAGQLAADLDPESAARSLLLSFQGLLVLARSGAANLHAHIDATFDSLARH